MYASLSVDSKTTAQGLNDINSKLNSIKNVLKSNGVNDNDLTTSSISVYPRYNYTNGSNVIIGYTVSISLTVGIRGIDSNSQKIANIIDGLVKSGVTSIYGLTYDTVDPNAGKSAARKNAWNDASGKAREYAQLAGRKLGKVVIIEEKSLTYYPYFYRTTNSSLGNDPNLAANG